MADLPWSRQVIQAHFDPGLLRQVSPDELSSAVEQALTYDGGFAPSGASLTGLLWQDPARDPVSVLAVAAFGGARLAVNISVDGTGLISGLHFRPYLSSWTEIDQELATLAPDASLLAARPGDHLRQPDHRFLAHRRRPLPDPHLRPTRPVRNREARVTGPRLA